MGTQYHLTRFAFLYETTIVGDGQALNPMGSDDCKSALMAHYPAHSDKMPFICKSRGRGI